RAGSLRNLEPWPGHPVDGALPLADPVLPGGVVLEPGGRGLVRLPDQHAAGAVLHAGPEPDAATRPHRTVRRVRHARHRADAVLPARPEAGRALARWLAARCVLEPQHRAGADGPAHAAA